MKLRIEPYEAMQLKRPAENRGVSYEYDAASGELILNGQCFDHISKAEDYLEQIPRID